MKGALVVVRPIAIRSGAVVTSLLVYARGVPRAKTFRPFGLADGRQATAAASLAGRMERTPGTPVVASRGFLFQSSRSSAGEQQSPVARRRTFDARWPVKRYELLRGRDALRDLSSRLRLLRQRLHRRRSRERRRLGLVQLDVRQVQHLLGAHRGDLDARARRELDPAELLVVLDERRGLDGAHRALALRAGAEEEPAVHAVALDDL